MQLMDQARDRREAGLGLASIVTGSAPMGAHNATTAEAPVSVAFDTALAGLPTFRPGLLLPEDAVEVKVDPGRVAAAMGLLMAQGPFLYLGSGRFVVPGVVLPVLDAHSIKYELAAEGEAA